MKQNFQIIDKKIKNIYSDLYMIKIFALITICKQALI